MKVLFTNECIYNCKYCINRRSNDVPRAAFTPEEICDLIYHLLVMMVEEGIPLEQVETVLEQRRQKIGNLKNFHESDHNT